MKIETGKYYKTRDGRKVGPMVWYSKPNWSSGGYWDGKIEKNENGSKTFPGVYKCGTVDEKGKETSPYDIIADWPSEKGIPSDGLACVKQEITLRDYFAGQALAGILAGGFADTIPHDDVNGGGDAAFFAYQYADAMLGNCK